MEVSGNCNSLAFAYQIYYSIPILYFLSQGDEKVIDDAFKERDPQRHCAMKGLPGRVIIFNKIICSPLQPYAASKYVFLLENLI